MLFSSRPRRRVARRLTPTFDALQARITPSDVTGTSDGLVQTSDLYVPSDYEMTIPGTYEVEASMSTDVDSNTMTIPTFVC
jgi:hypothetical protein